MAGNADEVGRHVLSEAEELLVRGAAASVCVPRTWMKMPAEPEEIESWLSQGQMASLGEAVVVDRVMTEEAHRRRGLGDFVMRALADHALEAGAVLGVLGATDAGRALYETLGWKKHATLAECVYRP
ncbi:GNAT family N-acetyltransferase [Streptomyces yokosukanensis]|uniref:GNAT family N-acetyltransferase n=1 Tax=Streptomyces yokosukanensis TaxID=67386 RepID=UPI00341270B0